MLVYIFVLLTFLLNIDIDIDIAIFHQYCVDIVSKWKEWYWSITNVDMTRVAVVSCDVCVVGVDVVVSLR